MPEHAAVFAAVCAAAAASSPGQPVSRPDHVAHGEHLGPAVSALAATRWHEQIGRRALTRKSLITEGDAHTRATRLVRLSAGLVGSAWVWLELAP